jgi:hypothetical protein
VREAGFDLRDSVVECLGSSDGAEAGNRPSNGSDAFGETVLRVAVESDSREAAERFSRELMPYITAGPQGTTGYSEGRPRVHSVFRYWPCLIARKAVAPKLEIVESMDATGRASPTVDGGAEARLTTAKWSQTDRSTVESPAGLSRPRCLYDIACARSGDKGTGANIGVIARSDDWWEFLRTWLSADRVAAYFSNLEIDSVERFELPNLKALNLVLRGALRQNLRTDAQGKALGQRLLEMPLPEDAVQKILVGKR